MPLMAVNFSFFATSNLKQDIHQFRSWLSQFHTDFSMKTI